MLGLFAGVYLFLTQNNRSPVPQKPPGLNTDPTPFHILPLASSSHFWGIFETIDLPDFAGFNPSILSLPDPTGNGNWTLVAVGRDAHRVVTIDANEVQPHALFGALLHIVDSDPRVRGRWAPRDYPHTPSHFVQMLDRLVRSDDFRFPKCLPDPIGWFYNNQGPEDGRLVWSHLGEPLLVYNSLSAKSTDLCRMLYLTDLRSVYPPLVDRLLQLGVEPTPLRFNKSVPLYIPGQAKAQKNWIPFTTASGEIYIHFSLVPQTIYKLDLSLPILPTWESPEPELEILEPVVLHTVDEPNCFNIALNGSDFHQSSPFVETVLCTYAEIRSGACDPTHPKNRIYMGSVHVLHHEDRGFYEPRIVTFEATLPFNYVSISKPLIYSMVPLFFKGLVLLIALVGTYPKHELVYTVSLSFRKREITTSPTELAVGYLDDILIISFGIADSSCHFLEVEVQEVLRDHIICENVLNSMSN